MGGYLVFMFVAVQVGENLIYENVSISEPLGYYLSLPGIRPHKGELVLTCITDNSYKHVFTELGMRDSGQCSNGLPYLIKRIVAEKGDKVEVTDSGILINSTLYPNSQQFAEGRGIKLYPLPIGYSHILNDNEYFMLGKSPHSVDSRYFGIIQKKDIYRKAVLIYKTSKINRKDKNK